jgi:cytoskeletal protein RodZ
VSEELHKLGEVLRAARESRGVDLARVERDTKIRIRYLSALERGEYRELPGAVYTKGFLRNYGHYLGLDPEYLTDLYRLETNGTGVERASPAPPRPITIRRPRALVVTPGAIAASLLTVAVIAFVGYLAYEFVTFARTPDLRIDHPAGDVAAYRQTSYTISGVTEPNSTITVDGLRENPQVKANAQGHFSVSVKLVPGSNVITLVAWDPVTQRNSDKKTRTINVDLGGASPTPASGSLALVDPREGATLTGPIRVTGTADPGSKVAIAARLVAPAAARFTVKTSFGKAVAVPAPNPGLLVSSTALAAANRSFAATLTLGAGTWDVTASPGSATTGSVTRRITVGLAAGLHGTLVVSGSKSYVLLLQDDVALTGVSGHVLSSGKSVGVAAKRTILVRAGNAAAVRLTINGVTLPVMGGRGEVVEWVITAR